MYSGPSANQWIHGRSVQCSRYSGTGTSRTLGLSQDGAHLSAEVAFDLQHQAADLAVRIVRVPVQELLDIRVHARRGLAGPDGTDDHQSRVQTTLRDLEPRRR